MTYRYKGDDPYSHSAVAATIHDVIRMGLRSAVNVYELEGSGRMAIMIAERLESDFKIPLGLRGEAKKETKREKGKGSKKRTTRAFLRG